MEKIKKALERAREDRGDTSIAVSTIKRNLDVKNRLKIEPKTKLKLQPSVLHTNRIIDITNIEDPILDYYRLLRSQVLQELNTTSAKTICVTSPNPNEGKSLTSINLAIGLSAQPEFEVILIDGDLRNPSVHTYLGVNVNKGLLDVLNSTATLDEATLSLGFNNSVVLPAGAPTTRSSELINSMEMKQLLAKLRQDPQRITVIDLPPVLSTEYAASLAAQADGVLLVVSEHDSKVKSVKKALSMLNASKATILGLVLNKSQRDPEVTYYHAEQV